MYVTYDDFNDNSFDTAKWEHTRVTGVELYERNQRLEFVWTGEREFWVADAVISTKVFELNAGKEYEIGVTVVACGMSASLVALVNNNYYVIGITSEGALFVDVVIDGTGYPLKSINVGKTSGKLAIGVTDSEVYFKFDENEVYRETYRLPSRSVNMMLSCAVSEENPLAAFDDAYFAVPEQAVQPEQAVVQQHVQTLINLLLLFMMLMILTSLIRTLIE